MRRRRGCSLRGAAAIRFAATLMVQIAHTLDYPKLLIRVIFARVNLALLASNGFSLAV